MQQAEQADTIRGNPASSGNFDDVSSRRRAIVLGAFAVPLVALAGGAVAAPLDCGWSARDWLARWGGLGCGASGSRHRSPELRPRMGDAAHNRAVAAMLAELASGDRLARVERILFDGDAALGHPDRVANALRNDRHMLASRISGKLPERPMLGRDGSMIDVVAYATWAMQALAVYEAEVFA